MSLRSNLLAICFQLGQGRNGTHERDMLFQGMEGCAGDQALLQGLRKIEPGIFPNIRNQSGWKLEQRSPVLRLSDPRTDHVF